jgi:hypothetical protein
MANQSKRGGMKQGKGKQPDAGKHQGVRPDSTASHKSRKESEQREATQRVAPKKPK